MLRLPKRRIDPSKKNPLPIGTVFDNPDIASMAFFQPETGGRHSNARMILPWEGSAK
jgi:hypothetical protein